MTKPRRTKVKFGGTEIPELFTEKLRGRVVYYFKNDKVAANAFFSCKLQQVVVLVVRVADRFELFGNFKLAELEKK